MNLTAANTTNTTHSGGMTNVPRDLWALATPSLSATLTRMKYKPKLHPQSQLSPSKHQRVLRHNRRKFWKLYRAQLRLTLRLGRNSRAIRAHLAQNQPLDF